jgi:predicted RNase H-like HicB family nuclease
LTTWKGKSVNLEDYLAVPYVAVVFSVRKPDGSWVRRAEYPELEGCWGEAPSVIEAIEQLDNAKARQIRTLLDQGKEVPVPRPPLKSGVSGLSDKPASWFADSKAR